MVYNWSTFIPKKMKTSLNQLIMGTQYSFNFTLYLLGLCYEKFQLPGLVRSPMILLFFAFHKDSFTPKKTRLKVLKESQREQTKKCKVIMIRGTDESASTSFDDIDEDYVADYSDLSLGGEEDEKVEEGSEPTMEEILGAPNLNIPTSLTIDSEVARYEIAGAIADNPSNRDIDLNPKPEQHTIVPNNLQAVKAQHTIVTNAYQTIMGKQGSLIKIIEDNFQKINNYDQLQKECQDAKESLRKTEESLKNMEELLRKKKSEYSQLLKINEEMYNREVCHIQQINALEEQLQHNENASNIFTLYNILCING